MKVDWLIVGAGFTGCTLAERIASTGQSVLIVERRNHVAGNAHDYYDENGVLIHHYGPHIFHTNSPVVWEYLSRFTDWRPYEHKVLAQIEGKKVPVPFNLNSLAALFPESYASKLEALLLDHCGYGAKIPILRLMESSNPELRTLAQYIYDNVFYGYTVKQWDLTPEELSSSVTGRVPVHVSRDDRYFQDKFQAMPKHGYTEMFNRMIDHPNISVLLQCDYADVAGEISYDRMVYSGPIDTYFDHMHGALPYRSLRFDLLHHEDDVFQETAQINYPNDHTFTRTTEFKHLTGQRAQGTTVAVEYPMAYEVGVNEPYYPIPRDENRELYNLYLKEAESLRGEVVFAGRLADYKYYNMDQAVARALTVFDREIAGERIRTRAPRYLRPVARAAEPAG